MRRYAVFAILTLLFIPLTVLAQTPPPPPDPPDPLNLPWGWGPVDDIEIVDHGPSEAVVNSFSACDDCVLGFPTGCGAKAPLCDQALELYHWCSEGSCDSSYVLIKLGLPIENNEIYIRFAYFSFYGAPIYIWTYDTDGVTLLETRMITKDDMTSLGLASYKDLVCHEEEWLVFQGFFEARHNGYIKIGRPSGLGMGDATYISGLWIADRDHGIPNICEQPVPTHTPTPTHTDTPLPTPTGTITQTWTPTASPTPGATATFGPTSTSTPTPLPYATWTPSPSPTPWQTPMSTLSSWQITPDASITPIPTPTTLGALPTWADFPTVEFPTRVTRTPFPTLIWEELTTTPAPTATPYTLTVDTDDMFDTFGGINASINYTQVYSAGYMLTGSISGPVRVMRGTVRNYLPSLAVLVDAILIMLFIVIAVYVIKLILAIGGAIIKLIEVILEFIPL